MARTRVRISGRLGRVGGSHSGSTMSDEEAIGVTILLIIGLIVYGIWAMFHQHNWSEALGEGVWAEVTNDFDQESIPDEFVGKWPSKLPGELRVDTAMPDYPNPPTYFKGSWISEGVEDGEKVYFFQAEFVWIPGS